MVAKHHLPCHLYRTMQGAGGFRFLFTAGTFSNYLVHVLSLSLARYLSRQASITSTMASAMIALARTISGDI